MPANHNALYEPKRESWPRKSAIPLFVPNLRTCAFCGGEFQGRREFKCPGCRKILNVGEPRPASCPPGRERPILQLLATGARDKRIAEALHLSSGTIKQYMVALLTKYRCIDRTELAVKSALGRLNP